MITGAVRRHLDPTDVARAVQLLEDGERVQVVARRFGVSPSVVSRLWTRRLGSIPGDKVKVVRG